MSDFSINFIDRSRGLLPLERLATPINIIGAGAVGSALAITLAKMGFGIINVWDFDVIEDTNIGCQRYFIKDIGRYKVEALREMVKESSGFDITVYPEKFTGDHPLDGITINCTDSMEARKEIYDGLRKGSYYLDPRMSALVYNLFFVRKGDIKDNYMDSWYPDSEAEREPCTMRSTMFAAELLASRVAYYVFRLIRGEPVADTTIWDGKENAVFIMGS